MDPGVVVAEQRAPDLELLLQVRLELRVDVLHDGPVAGGGSGLGSARPVGSPAPRGPPLTPTPRASLGAPGRPPRPGSPAPRSALRPSRPSRPSRPACAPDPAPDPNTSPALSPLALSRLVRLSFGAETTTARPSPPTEDAAESRRPALPRGRNAVSKSDSEGLGRPPPTDRPGADTERGSGSLYFRRRHHPWSSPRVRPIPPVGRAPPCPHLAPASSPVPSTHRWARGQEPQDHFQLRHVMIRR